ncbi:uncharacterized protein LOC126459215 isoform X2 [Schistocerca serialis cubense]|uniref:uncharacterized protein LOC126459215 isoform X2 n=1 Tax=Schistocerca serialis cubense TaxID=2023355 RepID=UPI00214F50BF|nr:uncharacterized protein LOC126459215 isoform X2 [Schistocerca serialis cubense]
MAAALGALCCLSALCLATAAQAGANANVASVISSQSEQGSHPTSENVIPLLSQFSGQDPLEESTDGAGSPRQKRTFLCKKCGYGGGYGGRGGGYRQAYSVVVPVRLVVVQPHPVYYRHRPQGGYCDPCSRRRYYGGGGGGGSYAESFSYSRSYSYG